LAPSAATTATSTQAPSRWAGGGAAGARAHARQDSCCTTWPMNAQHTLLFWQSRHALAGAMVDPDAWCAMRCAAVCRCVVARAPRRRLQARHLRQVGTVHMLSELLLAWHRCILLLFARDVISSGRWVGTPSRPGLQLPARLGVGMRIHAAHGSRLVMMWAVHTPRFICRPADPADPAHPADPASAARPGWPARPACLPHHLSW